MDFSVKLCQEILWSSRLQMLLVKLEVESFFWMLVQVLMSIMHPN